MNTHAQSLAEDAALLDKVRAAVAASDRNPTTVLEEVAELVGRRRRSRDIYQKPLG